MKWQRFTVVDFVLLMLMLSNAMLFSKFDTPHIIDPGWLDEASCPEATQLEVMLSFIVWGSNFTSLVILTTQYAFQHRRTRLSEGELLWLSPISFWIIISVFSNIWPNPTWDDFSVGLQCLCSCLALICIIFRLIGKWGTATCHWTDIYGSLTCFFTGALMLYDYFVHPVVI